MSDNEIKAIICPNCGKLVSGNAEKCMHCGSKNPNMWGLAEYFRKWFGGNSSFIPFISTLCVSLYVLALLLDPSAIFKSSGMLSILSPSGQVLFKLGMTGSYAVDAGRWWTLITAIYLHGGILHIVFNVMWIRQLGPAVEDFYGISRSFLIFTVAGIFGFILSSYFGNRFTLGASGSIFGLLGALVYYGRKRGGSFGEAIYKQAGQWAIMFFIFGFLFPGVDNYAHGGGFIGGFATAHFLGFIESKRENRMHQLGAFAAILLTILSFILAILI